MKNRFTHLVFSLFLCFQFQHIIPANAQFAGLNTLSLETIFYEPFLPGVRPAPVGFHPANSHFYFNWNDSSYAQTGLYRVNLEGNLVEKREDDILPRTVLSPDMQQIAFTRTGNLFVATSTGSNEKMLFSAQSNVSNPVWSSDGSQIAFASGGDIWIMSLEEGSVKQVTNRSNNEPTFSLIGWVKNNSKLAVQQVDRSDYWDVLFPEYVPFMVEDGRSRRGEPHFRVSTVEIDSGDLKMLLEGEMYMLNTDISATGRYLALDYTDHAMKQREIIVYDLEQDSELSVFSEDTDGWFYGPLLSVNFAPEGDNLFFTSEESGWAHIYTIRADGSRLNRLTTGPFETSWAEWTSANTIVFASSERDSGLRDIYSININSGVSSRLTQSDAFRYNFQLSPNKRFVAYNSTTWNQPSDIYLMDLRRPREEVRLTNSVPDRFFEIDWQEPEYIQFVGRDETTRLTMDVLKPHDFDPNKTYPVVVFVHGAGSLQNVFQGWSRSYPREYMFHQILNRHDYVVVEVDYRHSTGYGRKFREDVTNWMGKYELEDIIDGLEYLNRQHGYLDMDRIGLYGGSYGGFMALYALSNAPEYFQAGAALRAVTNWENYFYANPSYTRPRLGHPDEDSIHYERSSPLSYADSLSRPAIILHGLIDNNVGFQDAAQYIDRLIKSGNTNFEMMMYPSERHAYQDPNSWHDQYLRIFNFFEKHLKP